ncbi:MAG TPA: HD domain-containing protein, partial [Candidatus Methanomethylia archaeon]|nr:HD domain-containing protein [Candidatus Methanomethylicia archaeon]
RKLSMIRARNLEVDLTALEAAALLHDICRGSENHAEVSARKAEEILRELGFPRKFIEKVVEAVRSHSFSGGRTPGSLEAKVLSDADKLDAMGAIGVFRAAAYGDRIDRGIDGLIKHAEEKLLKLRDLMCTKTGRRLAERRHRFLEEYLEELKRELREVEKEF